MCLYFKKAEKNQEAHWSSWFFLGQGPKLLSYVNSTMPFLHLIQTRPVAKVGILLTVFNVPSRGLAINS